MKEEAYKRARKRVKAKKGFYGHLSAYIAVGLFFFFLNITTDPGELWFYFPMLGWGIGLATHYFSVFGLPGTDVLTNEWEDREMDRELRRMGYDPEEDFEEEEADEYYEDDELELPEIRPEKQTRHRDEDFV